MKVTRYFQSCLLIEEGSARILIDPTEQEKDRDFGKLDAVIYTHEHPDHFDATMANNFIEQGIAPVYANPSTKKQIQASANEVKDGDELDIAGVKVKAVELPHCLMIDGSEGPQNTGYVFAGKLFHPGDGTAVEGVKVDVLAGPLTGPDVSMMDACNLAKQVGAKTYIPVHYDLIGTKPQTLINFTQWFKMPFEIKALDVGEATEL
jgi:L-ascorbate metabolism protein UlaG (beta-lactamase superfamily)